MLLKGILFREYQLRQHKKSNNKIMDKNIRQLMLLMLTSLMLTGVCCFDAKAVSGEKKCVYLVGNNGMWYPPLTTHESEFTPIYETAPGSNIFQGTAYFYENQWFRFYSDLEEENPDIFISDVWRRNYIGPTNDSNLPEIGKSGVYFTNMVVN